MVVVAMCRAPVALLVGAVGTSSVGMAKAKASKSGVTNATAVDL